MPARATPIVSRTVAIGRRTKGAERFIARPLVTLGRDETDRPRTRGSPLRSCPPKAACGCLLLLCFAAGAAPRPRPARDRSPKRRTGGGSGRWGALRSEVLGGEPRIGGHERSRAPAGPIHTASPAFTMHPSRRRRDVLFAGAACESAGRACR